MAPVQDTNREHPMGLFLILPVSLSINAFGF